MGILHVILILVEVITCLLLMGVILLQKSKGGGLGTALGGGASDAIFGSRTGNVLTKITVTLAIVFLANTALIGVLYTHRTETSIMDRAVGPVQAAPLAPPTRTPGSEPVAAPAQTPASASLLQDSIPQPATAPAAE